MPAIAASQILWGTGFDNVLSFDYPQGLDDTRTWRRPAPGSRRTRNPAGVTDAWINKREFCLAGRARWFARAAFGGSGLQDFLDWSGEGNTFRFVPDNRYSSFYVDGCYLDTPFDDPQPQLEQADGSQTVDIVIRQQTTDFTLAMRGLMFEYVPGKSLTDPAVATFTRASTANRIGRDSILASDAINAIRDRHFIAGVRSSLLEKGSANLCLQSENFGTTWAAVGTPTRVASAHTASGVTLDLIGDDDGAAQEYYSQTIAFTGNAVKAISVHVKEGTIDAAAGSLVYLTDLTAVADRLSGVVTWSGGIPSVAASVGTYLGKEPLADGVWRLFFQTTSVTAANTNSLRIVPAVTAAQQGNIYAGGIQAEDNAFPTSYKKTTTVTVSRSADSPLVFPFAFAPQVSTFYAKFVERGTSFDNSARILEIGDGAANPRFVVYHSSGGVYRAFHETPSNNVASVLAAGPSFGDTVELLAVLNADGSVQISQSLNGGAATTAAATAALLLRSAWVAAFLRINDSGTNAFQILRVAAGVKTMADLRAA